MEVDPKELVRLRTLDQLGVDVYGLRRPLPGAAPSRVFIMSNAPAEANVPLPEQPPKRSAVLQKFHDVMLSGGPEDPPAHTFTSADVGARFRCRTAAWAWPQGVLIIADIEEFAQNRARMQALERLVVEVHRSVAERGDDVSGRFSRFDWPVVDTPLADSSLRRAAEVFDGFLRQRLADYDVTAVIILGEVPASLLAVIVDRADLQVPSVVGPSPAALFADAAHKVVLWRALQALRAPGR